MKKKTQFRLIQFRWLFLVDLGLLIGGVMAFGSVASRWFHLDRGNAIFMLGMVPAMMIVVGLSTAIIMKILRKKMGILLDGIQAVADGNLSIQLSSKGAGEYESIYENFNRMVREMERTKSEMDNFVNEFSHEFKTPITSIYGFSQLLLETGDGIESPERMKYLQVIADESLRLSDLSQKTLLLSKVEACEIITDKENYSLDEQLKHCTILLLPDMEKKKIHIEMDVPQIFYYGNTELLSHVWINLLGNAVKFTPENGEIEVQARESSGQITVEIADNGAGMDEETVAHVFDKYYQSQDGHKKGGNGIGLAIAHRIVTLCGGTIEVKSQLGSGSVFLVTLPKHHSYK